MTALPWPSVQTGCWEQASTGVVSLLVDVERVCFDTRQFVKAANDEKLLQEGERMYGRIAVTALCEDMPLMSEGRTIDRCLDWTAQSWPRSWHPGFFSYSCSVHFDESSQISPDSS